MRALLVALGACLLGAAAYGVSLLIELRAATAPATPTEFVQATWSVYRFGPGHQAHVGELSLACPACHQAQENGRFDRPGPAACVSCHEARSQIVHAMVDVDTSGHRVAAGVAEERVADCLVCHGFGPDPEKRANDCLACHAHTQGHTPAIVTHADVDCQDCHDVHGNRVVPLKCAECHSINAQHGQASSAVRVRGSAPGQDAGTSSPHEQTVEQTCLTCHQAHGRAAPALEGCRECHSPQASQARWRALEDAPASDLASVGPEIAKTATFPGHTCTGCHAPHSFTSETATACTTCHTQVHVLAGKGHQSCTACHAPHSTRESVARNVCVDCHKDVRLQHNQPVDASTACTSCHAAHPASTSAASAHSASSSCTNCHRDVGHEGKRAHAGNLPCTSCHTPHAFALPAGQKACTACHAAEATRAQSNAGHAVCTGCHQDLPHGPELGAKSCTSCHTEVHAQQGHSTCTSCHEPHNGAQTGKACADCHASEARAGIHNAMLLHGKTQRDGAPRCTQCHDQHSTALAPGVADCTACHARAKLPGLHEVREHAAACTSCHMPHDDALPGARATCLACHEDRRDHQPEAKRCEGCHQFVSASRGVRGSP